MNQKPRNQFPAYGAYDYSRYWGDLPEEPKYKKHLKITSTNVILGVDKSDKFLTLDKGRSTLGEKTLELCQKILCVTRASKSKGQDSFALWLENEIVKNKVKVEKDHYGNIIALIDGSDTMFTSHIDTCHKPSDPATQPIYYDADKDILFKDDTMCMGADDGTGVYIMLEMIRNRIPGTYAFFRDEEIGRVGSQKFFAQADKKQLAEYKRCISFDRAGGYDIVKSQSPGVCCSNEFVKALADELAEVHLEVLGTVPAQLYAGAPGSYTDSASFMTVIPECTNMSVGYKSQHGPNETQCVATFKRVLELYPNIDWDKLPTVRDPSKVPEPKTVAFGGSKAPPAKKKAYQAPEEIMEGFLMNIDSDLVEMMELIESSPRYVAYALARDGYTTQDLTLAMDMSYNELEDQLGDMFQ